MPMFGPGRKWGQKCGHVMGVVAGRRGGGGGGGRGGGGGGGVDQLKRERLFVEMQLNLEIACQHLFFCCHCFLWPNYAKALKGSSARAFIACLGKPGPGFLRQASLLALMPSWHCAVCRVSPDPMASTPPPLSLIPHAPTVQFVLNGCPILLFFLGKLHFH